MHLSQKLLRLGLLVDARNPPPVLVKGGERSSAQSSALLILLYSQVPKEDDFECVVQSEWKTSPPNAVFDLSVKNTLS